MSETYGQYEQRTLRETIASQALIIERASAAPVVQVSVRSNYGAPAIYPANEAARIFAAIAGTKTLQLNTLAKAKALGYRIERAGDSINVPGLSALVEG